MKKILITGGAGYIGSMVSTKLVQQGFDVTVIDKLNYDPRSLCHLLHYENFNFVEKDILDKKFIKKHNSPIRLYNTSCCSCGCSFV